MKAFEPKAVPPDSWRHWATEALNLCTAQWLPNTVLVLGLLGGVQLLQADAGRLLLGCLAPGLVALFAAVASRAHTPRRLHQVLRGSLPGMGRAVLCAATVLAVLYAVLAAIAGALAFSGAGAPAPGMAAEAAPAAPAAQAAWVAGTAASDFAAGQSALLVLFLWLLVPLLFFLLPLLVCAHMPVRQALALARQAQQLNPFAWRVGAAAGLLCLAGAMWNGVAAVPFYPLIGTLLYVAYRHVFLGMPPETATQTSHARWPALPSPTWSSHGSSPRRSAGCRLPVQKPLSAALAGSVAVALPF